MVLEVEEGNRLTGIFAPVWKLVFEGTMWNITHNSADKIGNLDPVTNLYDGCLGMLQRNESDFHFPLIDFPIIADGLKQGDVLQSSRIMISSTYKNTMGESATEVLDAFLSFTRGLWLTITLTTIVLALLLLMTLQSRSRIRRMFVCGPRTVKVKAKQRRRFSRSIRVTREVVIGNVLKQHTAYCCQGRLFTCRFLLLLFAVFTFHILFYFSSMIKTDMVVQKRPLTIDTYEDLLDRPEVRPKWGRPLSDHWKFMRADPDSPEGRIWKRAQEKGINDSFIEADLVAIQGHILEIAEQKMVWLGCSYLVPALLTNACALSRSSGAALYANAYVRSDPGEQETLVGVAVSASLSRLSDHILHRTVQSVYEVGLLQMSLKTLDYVMAKDTGTKEMRDCVANEIVYPDHDVKYPDVYHYRFLILLTTFFYVVAGLVFYAETGTRAQSSAIETSAKAGR